MSNITIAFGKNNSNSMERKNFLKIWRSGVTVLAHKKDNLGKPENFRPITLHPVLSKIFTFLIRNRLHTFAVDNGYTETNIQKGFWEKISECVEHIETMAHMINNARIKQRGCVITSLDLKNAFGKVNHNLFVQTLKIHHVSDDIITLISSSYTDYTISVITDTFMTSPIKVQRGVLLGDNLSPLLFNLIVSTLIKYDQIWKSRMYGLCV